MLGHVVDVGAGKRRGFPVTIVYKNYSIVTTMYNSIVVYSSNSSMTT